MCMRYPRFSLLSREQCEAIHLASLEILRRTGVRVHHPEALALLRQSDAVITDENLVRFPAGVGRLGAETGPVAYRLVQARDRSAGHPHGRRGSGNFGTGSDCNNYLNPLYRQARALHVEDGDRLHSRGGCAARDRLLHVDGRAIRSERRHQPVPPSVRADAQEHHQAHRLHLRRPGGLRGDRGDGGSRGRRHRAACASTPRSWATARRRHRCNTPKTHWASCCTWPSKACPSCTCRRP